MRKKRKLTMRRDMNILQTIAQESKVEVISTVKMATSDKELKDFLENN